MSCLRCAEDKARSAASKGSRADRVAGERTSDSEVTARGRAVLAKLLRNGVLGERDRIGLVGRVELELLLGERRIVAPKREVDRVNGSLLVGRTSLRQETLLDADAPKNEVRRGGCEATAKPTARACARMR